MIKKTKENKKQDHPFSLKDPIPQPPLDRGIFDIKKARQETKELQSKTNKRGSK